VFCWHNLCTADGVYTWEEMTQMTGVVTHLLVLSSGGCW